MRYKALTLALCCGLRMYGQSDAETGTLNIGYLVGDSAILTSDSGLAHAYPPPRDSETYWASDGGGKLIPMGPSSACAIDGHESYGPDPHLDISHELLGYAKEHPVLDLDEAFGKLEDLVLATLKATNKGRLADGKPLLRAGDSRARYLEADGGYYVTGMICIGLSLKAPILRSSHFSTDPKSGRVYEVAETPGSYVAKPQLATVTAALAGETWKQTFNALAPVPNWPNYLRSMTAYDAAMAKNRAVSAGDLRGVFKVLYFESILDTCGKIRPPIRLWEVSPLLKGIKQGLIDFGNLSLPPFCPAANSLQ